jgi:hypothetical protein
MGLMLIFNKYLPFLQDKAALQHDLTIKQQPSNDAVTTPNKAQ